MRIALLKVFQFSLGAPLLPKSELAKARLVSTIQCTDFAQRSKLLLSIEASDPLSGLFLVPKRYLTSFIGQRQLKSTPELEGGETARLLLETSTASYLSPQSKDDSLSLQHQLDSVPSIPLNEFLKAVPKSNSRAKADEIAAQHFQDQERKNKKNKTSPKELELLSAARKGDIEAVSRLVELEGVDINVSHHEHGATPLHFAAAYGTTECVTYLLRKGANLNICSTNGSTPLHWAAGSGRTDTSEVLLHHGAATENKTSTWHTTVTGASSGQTPIHWAADAGHEKAIEALVDHNPNLLAAKDERDNTASKLASKAKRGSVVSVLETRLEEQYVYVHVHVEMVADAPI